MTITNIDELLALDDAAFVDAAYTTLLGRAVDPSGMRHYLSELRGGAAKMRIVTQISNSEEGRARGTTLPGLRRALRHYRLACNKWTRWWARPVLDVEGESPWERRQRIIEITLTRMQAERASESQENQSAADEVTRLLVALAGSGAEPMRQD